MARLGSGVVTEVSQATTQGVRIYAFRFDYTDVASIRCSLDGVEVDPRRFAVSSPGGAGTGQIRFLGASEVANPVVVTSGPTLRIWRDTTAARITDFPLQGRAGAASVERLAGHTMRLVQELTASVVADFRQALQDYANENPTAIDPALVRATIEQAVLTTLRPEIPTDGEIDGRANARIAALVRPLGLVGSTDAVVKDALVALLADRITAVSPVRATSVVLPLTGTHNDDQIMWPFIGGDTTIAATRWTLTPSSGNPFVPVNGGANLQIDPSRLDDNTTTIVVDSFIGASRQARSVLPIGPGAGVVDSMDASSTSESVLPIKAEAGGGKTIIIRHFIAETSGVQTVQFRWDGDIPDPNTTLRLHMGGAFLE